jgi:putative oxidoreductase
MIILFIIAHLTIGIYFLNSGLSHFFNVNYMAGYAASKGVPLPKTAVIISGITLAIGGISLVGWIAPVIGLGLIILTLIPVTTMMHDFWNVKDPMQRVSEKIGFNKNIALIGSLLLVLALFI